MDWVIAFDFDGVLVNPVKEVAIAATKTFNELLNGANYEPKFFKEKFQNSLHIIRTGKDVMPIMQLIAEGRKTEKMKRSELNEFKQMLGEKKVLELEEEYYKRKGELRENTRKWLSTIKTHKKAIQAFKKISKKFNPWIVTTRDTASVIELLNSEGYSMDSNKVIDKEYSHNKDEQFELLRKKTGVPFKQIVFFEDTIYNSQIVNGLGVRVFLSTWGFSNEKQWKNAEKKGIKPIKQGEIIPSVENVTGVKI